MKDDEAIRQFEAFVVNTTDLLYRTSYFMTGDAREAEDLLQETFAQVAARWERVRSADRRLAYARRILINLALDGSKRRARRRSELRLSVEGPNDRRDEPAARALRAVEDADEQIGVLGALSPGERAVLFLRYWEDLSEVETARTLGCSVGTVKKTTWRAMVHLRQRLVLPAAHGKASNAEGGLT